MLRGTALTVLFAVLMLLYPARSCIWIYRWKRMFSVYNDKAVDSVKC